MNIIIINSALSGLAIGFFWRPIFILLLASLITEYLCNAVEVVCRIL